MNNKVFKYGLFIFTVLLIILLTSADFFHNHQASVNVVSHCPVYVLQTTLLAGLIFFILFLLFTDLEPDFKLDFYQVFSPRLVPSKPVTDRAPPQ